MVPSHGEHVAAAWHLGRVEVTDNAVRRVPELAGRARRYFREDPCPERRRGREAVDQTAALDEGRAVPAHEGEGVEQIAVEAGDVALASLTRELPGAKHARPQDRIEVECPADIVVVCAFLTIRQPAVGPVEGVVQGQVLLDVVTRPRATDGTEERLDDDPEPQPVGPRIAWVAYGTAEVLDEVAARRGL